MCNKDNDFDLKERVETNGKQVNKGRTYKSIDEVHIRGDSVNTIQNDEATILYIVAMLGGAIFEDRILIWISATVIYFWHITRFKRRR